MIMTMNITLMMTTAAGFAMEAAKKLQSTLTLARTQHLISNSEYESANLFMIRVADLCKAVAEEKVSLIEYYAERLDKISNENQAEILNKAATLNPRDFKEFIRWMEELEKAMI
jgi:2-hydroxy-3-keto-5-methylthiopentenyl-1-phosphate phosphatase